MVILVEAFVQKWRVSHLKNNFEEYKKYIEVVSEPSGNIELSDMFITPPKYFLKNDFHLIPLFIDDGNNSEGRRLNAKVEYTDQDALILPSIIDTSGGNVEINFGVLGIYKSKQCSVNTLADKIVIY